MSFFYFPCTDGEWIPSLENLVGLDLKKSSTTVLTSSTSVKCLQRRKWSINRSSRWYPEGAISVVSGGFSSGIISRFLPAVEVRYGIGPWCKKHRLFCWLRGGSSPYNEHLQIHQTHSRAFFRESPVLRSTRAWFGDEVRTPIGCVPGKDSIQASRLNRFKSSRLSEAERFVWASINA